MKKNHSGLFIIITVAVVFGFFFATNLFARETAEKGEFNNDTLKIQGEKAVLEMKNKQEIEVLHLEEGQNEKPWHIEMDESSETVFVHPYKDKSVTRTYSLKHNDFVLLKKFLNKEGQFEGYCSDNRKRCKAFSFF
jgi:hypothetical protein